jgi:hypothetical protein
MQACQKRSICFQCGGAVDFSVLARSIRAGHISDQDIFRTTPLTYKSKSISKM